MSTVFRIYRTITVEHEAMFTREQAIETLAGADVRSAWNLLSDAEIIGMLVRLANDDKADWRIHEDIVDVAEEDLDTQIAGPWDWQRCG